MKKYIRKNILDLEPYSTARDEFKGGEVDVWLDANESPYNNGVNRYPDPHQKKLKARISELFNIPSNQIFAGGAGSDEAIDVVYRIFCEPGRDNAISIAPSYGVYKVSAAVNDIELREVLLNDDYSLPVERLLNVADEHSKLIWICSPNNPTGNAFPRHEILKVAEQFDGMVVVDEAYGDFSDEESIISAISDHPNIIVLRTFSKAWGMAGMRAGMAFASPEVITYMDRVKYPYNMSALIQSELIKRIEAGTGNHITEIKQERDKLAKALAEVDCVETVYRSDSNFLLVKVTDANAIYDYLVDNGVIVRNRTKMPLCQNTLRITVGTPSENEVILALLKNYGKNDTETCNLIALSRGRSASIARNTSETKIEVKINLDGNGESVIDTGLKFLDHMLWQIPHHAGITLVAKCKGDLEVDEHHTMEDVAIALGDALLKALGDKRGIERYGFVLPMDECDAMVLMDLGGRIDFQWSVPFTREYVGDTPTEMFKHFFQSLCCAMKCNLHISAREKTTTILSKVFSKPSLAL